MSVPLAVGPNTITVEVTAEDGTKKSYTVTVTRAAAAPTVTVSASDATPTFGATVTLTAVLAGGSSPSGTVTFRDGAITLGTNEVNFGTATFDTAALTVGTHTITAEYAGDTNNTGATSAAITVTVAALPVPAITAINPDSGSTAGGTVVTITGSDLAGVDTVTFSDQPATITSVSATEISVTAPPHAAGQVDVTVDDSGNLSTLPGAYTYVDPLVISPGAGNLPGGTVGSSYSQTITASGGTPSYAFTATGLPAGLSFSSTGVISGTPTAAGSSSITVEVTDGEGTTASVSYTLEIVATNPAAPVIGTATAGDGQATISFTAPANDGRLAITQYMVTSNPGGITATGTASPITITGLTNGTDYTFTVTATTSAGTGLASVASNSVRPMPATTPVALSPASGTHFHAGTANVAYTATITASGGSGSYIFSATGLPPGLSIDSTTGVISGVPAAWYSYTTQVMATDATDPTNSATATYSFPIAANSILNDAIVGVLYPDVRLAAGGSATPSSGSIPPGMYITVTGARYILSGIPIQTGTYVFGFPGGSRYTITVKPAQSPTITNVDPAIGSTTGGTSVTITGTNFGAASMVTFAGSNAISFTINSSTEIVAVTPAHAAGPVSVAVTTPGGTGSLTNSFVYEGGVGTIAFTTSDGGTLPNGMPEEQYSASIIASGGVGAYQYEVISGELPDGIVLDPNTGKLTGTLAADADLRGYNFTVEAKDADGSSGVAGFTITVTQRAVTAPDKSFTVAPGSTPLPVDLEDGATGGPFTAAAVAYVEPANAGTASIILGELADASSVPVDVRGMPFKLKFIPDPAFSGTAVVGYTLINEDLVGIHTASGTVTYNLGVNVPATAAQIDSLVHGFVSARQGMISSTIEVPGLLDRRRIRTATDPVSGSLSPNGDGVTLNFATSLVQMNAAANAAAGVVALGNATDAPFNIWADGTLMVHNREQNGDQWGSFAMLSLGADYLLNDKALIGLSLHLDHMTDPTDQDAELTGNGWLAGPYASFEIGQGVFLDASLLYGGSDNDIDTAFFDGGFETTRWMADVSLTGQWQLDELTTLTPRLRAVYVNEEVADYEVANAAGTVIGIAGFTQEQFRVSLGAELEHVMVLGNGLTLIPNIGVTAGVSTLDTSSLFGSLTTGFRLSGDGDWTMDSGLLLNFDDEGAKSAGVKAGVNVRF